MGRILTPSEWQLRCLLSHFETEDRRVVFIQCHKRQNMSGGLEIAAFDYRLYEECGHIPSYVVAEFYRLFPWNRRDDGDDELLAAE